MARPATLPIWATAPADPLDVVIPALGKQALGWSKVAGVPEKPPYEWFNWYQNLSYQWAAYWADLTDVEFTQLKNIDAATMTAAAWLQIARLGAFAVGDAGKAVMLDGSGLVVASDTFTTAKTFQLGLSVSGGVAGAGKIVYTSSALDFNNGVFRIAATVVDVSSAATLKLAETTAGSAGAGSFQTLGGIYAAKAIYCATTGTFVTSVTSPTLYGSAVAGSRLTLKGNSSDAAGGVDVTSTTVSTTYATGALTVAGGFGLAGALFCNSTATFATSVSTPIVQNGITGVFIGEANNADNTAHTIRGGGGTDKYTLLNITCAGTGGHAYSRFVNSNSKVGYFGMSGRTNGIITGSAANDLCIAVTDGNILFSGNDGGAIHGKISTAGAWTFPVSIAVGNDSPPAFKMKKLSGASYPTGGVSHGISGGTSANIKQVLVKTNNIDCGYCYATIDDAFGVIILTVIASGLQLAAGVAYVMYVFYE